MTIVEGHILTVVMTTFEMASVDDKQSEKHFPKGCSDLGKE